MRSVSRRVRSFHASVSSPARTRSRIRLEALDGLKPAATKRSMFARMLTRSGGEVMSRCICNPTPSTATPRRRNSWYGIADERYAGTAARFPATREEAAHHPAAGRGPLPLVAAPGPDRSAPAEVELVVDTDAPSIEVQTPDRNKANLVAGEEVQA